MSIENDTAGSFRPDAGRLELTAHLTLMRDAEPRPPLASCHAIVSPTGAFGQARFDVLGFLVLVGVAV
jgi:hypothetical protein